MYKDRVEPTFELPVPGMAMTHEVGARPWQTPAQYTNVDDVAQFYIGQMQSDTFTDQVTSLLETKMPVTMIANSMNTVNIMEGVHSIDVGILTMPIIMETIMLIAEQQGIDYVTGLEQNYDAQVIDTDVEAVSQKIENKENIQTPDEQIIEEQDDDVPLGLMSRRS